MLSPIDGAEIARVRTHSAAQVTKAIAGAQAAFTAWREVPAPRRGELIRLLGDELRAEKDALGKLVSIETGKILSEGSVEQVQSGTGLARDAGATMSDIVKAVERVTHIIGEITTA